MGTHDGHRQRMRERIASDGIRSLHDHEVLEYLLFPFVPRRNTNEIAHRLMEKFGTFSEVFNADAADLAAVSGMTENAALFFSVLPEVLRRYAVSVAKKRPQLSGRRAVRDFLAGVMFGMPVEAVCAAALDAQDGLIRFDILQRARETESGSRPATRWFSRCRARRCRWCLHTTIRAAILAPLSRTTTSPAPSPRLSAECRSRLPTTSSIRTRKAILLRKTGCSEERLKRSFEWKRR